MVSTLLRISCYKLYIKDYWNSLRGRKFKNFHGPDNPSLDTPPHGRISTPLPPRESPILIPALHVSIIIVWLCTWRQGDKNQGKDTGDWDTRERGRRLWLISLCTVSIEANCPDMVDDILAYMTCLQSSSTVTSASVREHNDQGIVFTTIHFSQA